MQNSFRTLKAFALTLALCLGLGTLTMGSALAQKATTEAAKSAQPAVADSPAAAPIQPAPAAVEAPIENVYGLTAIWAQSDAVAKTTLLILLIMSVGSWYVIATKLLEQAKVMRFAKAADENFWSQSDVLAGSQALHQDSPFRYIAEIGLESSKSKTGMLGVVDTSTWISLHIERAIGNVQARMQDGLALLATVGSTAPFVGLFGTVWGIYNALIKIGLTGQASIDKIAGPVGESLIMTAIGLAVAVPAVLGYNWLVRSNKPVVGEVTAFGAELHSVLLASYHKRSTDKV